MFIRLDNFRRLALLRGSIHKAFRLVHTREAHLEAKFRLSTGFVRRSLRQTFPYKISADVTINLGQCLGSGLPVVYAQFSSTGGGVIVGST